MKKIIIILFGAILFVTCKNNKIEISDDEHLIKINLENKGKNNPIGDTQRPFSFFDSIPKEFKGVVNKDSSIVGYLNTIDSNDLRTLYINEKITKKQYENTQTKIYCWSGYNNGKQFYCIDINGNKDFSDDKIVEFDKEITYKTEYNLNIHELFPAITLKINKIENDNIYQDEVSVNVYPNALYFSNNHRNELEKFRNSLQLLCQFNDYLDGHFFIKDKKYKVFLDKYAWNGYNLYFSQNDIPFRDKVNKLKGRYKLDDTIKISESYYKIKDATINPPLIKLDPISMNEEVFGFREGYTMKNFEIENLEGNITNIKDLFNERKLILIDFWGTWCGPCKELTPDLINMNKEFNRKITLISLAYEQDPMSVKDYVKANKMSWYNGIIKGTPKSAHPKARMIKELRIISFPTFILIDENLKIIYRGSGNILEELSSIIKNY